MKRATELVLHALLVTTVVVGTVSTASAQDGPKVARRSNRYGREGAEIWIEAPRLTLASGSGYRNGVELTDEYEVNVDLNSGWGFGFGIFFAMSDNILFEGRMLQSVHTVDAFDDVDARDWDLDQAYIGVRYVFRYENQFQPSVGVGGLRYSLEYDPASDDFVRMTGFGGYVSVGVDYIISRRWALLLRADYSVMGYTNALYGTDDLDISDTLDGSAFGVSVGLSYRIPMW